LVFPGQKILLACDVASPPNITFLGGVGSVSPSLYHWCQACAQQCGGLGFDELFCSPPSFVSPPRAKI